MQNKEVKERWGNTDAYKEHFEKTKNCTKEKWTEINNGLMNIFSDFADCKQTGAKEDSDKAQLLVSKLQSYITENYYSCTDEILLSLGQMYVLDERFKNNIDRYSTGTADFVSEAIKKYLLI